MCVQAEGYIHLMGFPIIGISYGRYNMAGGGELSFAN